MLVEKLEFEIAERIDVCVDERRTEVFGYFKNREDGLLCSRGKGWYGANGMSGGAIEVMTVHTESGESFSFPMSSRIQVIRSVEHNKQVVEQRKREHALSKLTKEEKRILGLIV